jgi:hypothetical protein
MIIVFICLYALLLLFWYAYVASSLLFFHMPIWCTFYTFCMLLHSLFICRLGCSDSDLVCAFHMPLFLLFSLVLWPMMNTMSAMIKWPRSVCSFRLVLFSVWYPFFLFLLSRHFWATLTMTNLWLIWTMIWGPYLVPFLPVMHYYWGHVLLLLGFVSLIAFICMFGDEEQGIFVLRPSPFFMWQYLFVLPCRLLMLLQGPLCSYSGFCYHLEIGEAFSLFYVSLRAFYPFRCYNVFVVCFFMRMMIVHITTVFVSEYDCDLACVAMAVSTINIASTSLANTCWTVLLYYTNWRTLIVLPCFSCLQFLCT